MRASISLVILGWALSAAAELRPFELNHPDEHGLFGNRPNRYALDIGVYSGDAPDDPALGLEGVSRLAVASSVTITAPVYQDEVIFQWGFIYYSRDANTTGEGQSLPDVNNTLLGNPYLGYHWVWRNLGSIYRVGLGGGAPLASIRDDKGPDDTLVDVEGYRAWAGINGLKDVWLIFPEYASGVLEFSTEQHLDSGFTWGLGVKGAAMFNVGDHSDGEREILAQLEGDITWQRVGSRFTVRGSFIQLLDTESDDKEQLALTPEMALRFSNFDLVLGLTLPIDEPLGPFHDKDKDSYWGLHLGLTSPTEKPKTRADDEALYEAR